MLPRSSALPAAALVALVAVASDASAQLRFAPAVSLTQSLGYFVHHESAEDRAEFQYDWRNRLGLALVSLHENKLLWLESRLAVRTGRASEGLGVDPSYTDLGFGIIGEWRLAPATLWLGLDHASFHTIDRPLELSIWWWKIYAAAGSPGTRPVYDPWDVPLGGPGAARRAFDWRVALSYWPERLPLLEDEGSKGNPWKADALLALRATVLNRRGFALQLHSHTGLERERTDWLFRGEPLAGAWRGYQAVGVELSRPGATFVWSGAIDAVLTDGRRPGFNREGLVRAALGFFH
jgi:hypothetical protein